MRGPGRVSGWADLEAGGAVMAEEPDLKRGHLTVLFHFCRPTVLAVRILAHMCIGTAAYTERL